jgi:hypothetical protein
MRVVEELKLGRCGGNDTTEFHLRPGAGAGAGESELRPGATLLSEGRAEGGEPAAG